LTLLRKRKCVRLVNCREQVARRVAIAGRTYVQDLFYGGALVIAVTLSQLVRGREERFT
jgi:hypothetical protein